MADLLDAMVDVEATHVVHVELIRDRESRFYNTTDGVNALHRVVVRADSMEAQLDSHTPLTNLKLGQGAGAPNQECQEAVHA